MTTHTTHHTRPADDDTLIATSDEDSEDKPPTAFTLISIPEGASCDALDHCSEILR